MDDDISLSDKSEKDKSKEDSKVEKVEADKASKEVNKGEKEMVASNELIRWDKETKVIGFLVDYDADPNGQVAIIRLGRVIVSSDAVDKGSCFVIDDETVSPMHAILLAKESSVIVLDQLSEYGTTVERAGGEKLDLSGDKATLEHGDVLSFGEKKYKVCLVA